MDLDLDVLRKVSAYDGYEPSDQIVAWFWEVVAEFSGWTRRLACATSNPRAEAEKKQLLSFTTGTDRVAIGGLAKTKFVIAKQGPDSDRLPSAHTCFNVLLLPNYASKEKLDAMLRKAILHAEGFGLR